MDEDFAPWHGDRFDLRETDHAVAQLPGSGGDFHGVIGKTFLLFHDAPESMLRIRFQSNK
jgi:hypothetical protein